LAETLAKQLLQAPGFLTVLKIDLPARVANGLGCGYDLTSTEQGSRA